MFLLCSKLADQESCPRINGYLKMCCSGKVLLKLLILTSFLQNTSTVAQISPIIKERTPPSSTIYLAEHGERSLTCRAEGNPTPRVTWLYNEKEVYSADITTDRDKVLNFRVMKIIAGDFGKYQCRASNTFGTVTSRSIFVEHAEMLQPSGFIPQEQTIMSKQGDTIKLNCVYNINVKPPAVSLWKKNAETISNSQRIYTDSKGHLWIHNLEKLDEGKYTCEIKNLELSAQLLVTTVEVKSFQAGPTNGAPFLKNSHDKFVESRGETAVLSANIIDPSNVCSKISWRRSDGGPMDPNRISSSPATPQMLKVKLLNRNDSGYYDVICWKQSHPLLLGSLFLHVTDPSKITRAPKLQQVAIGTDVAFTCVASGDPLPTLSWSVNNNIIGATKGYNWTIVERGEQLKLLKVRTNVSVACRATNYHGSQTAQTSLLVFGSALKEITNETLTEATTTTISTTTQVPGTTPTLTIITSENEHPVVGPASSMEQLSMGINSATFIVIVTALVIVIFLLVVYIVYIRRQLGRKNRQGGPGPGNASANGRSDEAAPLTDAA